MWTYVRSVSCESYELKIVGHANVTLVSSLCMRLAISCACMSTHWCMHAIVSFVRLKTDITTEVSRRASWSLTPALSPCTGPSPVFNLVTPVSTLPSPAYRKYAG